MCRWLKVFFVLLLTAGPVIYARAQHVYVVTHLDNRDGLSNNNVTDVFQDSDRLLWVSTHDGLNVYNGNSFQLFKSDEPGSAFSLPDNVLLNVLEDRKKHIWICAEKGVTCYDKANGSFRHFFYRSGKQNGPGSADYFMSISPKGAIVAGLRLDSVLYVYDEATKNIKPVRFNIPSLGLVAEIGFDDQDRLWVLSLGGTLRVFTQQQGSYVLQHAFNMNGIHLFFLVNHRVLFANGAKDLYEIGPDFQFRKLTHMSRLITSIAFFKGHYFVSYTYKGMQEYDENFNPVRQLVNDEPQLENLEINSFYAGAGDVLWAATADHGLYKIVRYPNHFGTVSEVTPGKPLSSSVTSLLTLGNELWVGTRNAGVIRYPVADGFRSGKIVQPVNSSFDDALNSYYTLKKGADGNVYIGSDAQGVTIYDPQSNRFIPWLQIKGAHFDSNFFRAYAILPAADTSVYVGYLHGLVKLKVKKDADGNYTLTDWKEYRNERRFLNLGNNAVYAMAQRGDWLVLGYQYAGLVLLNTKDGRTLNILSQPGLHKLSSNNITSLYLDSHDRLWIGTSNGLNWIRFPDLLQSQSQFHILNTSNGLPDHTIHGIIEDRANRLWVSTNKGLARINTVTRRIVQYRAQDGLQNDEFSDGAVTADASGKLYFGGVSGFNVFDPHQISVDKTLPNLLISDLSFGGQNAAGIRLTIIKPGADFLPQHYVVEHNQNFFHLNVAPANGFANLKFKYQYFLENLDSRWHDASENSRVEYSNLSPGNYQFYVRWSNGQGEWSAKKEVFEVVIKPYFLWSAAAKIVYLIIITGVAYILFRVQQSRREIKNKLSFENFARVKEQKLYEEKVNFFTNITHELQTPLTLILGSIERFFHQHQGNNDQRSYWRFLRIANQEAFRLQYLVHQLLEFRKAESGHAKITLNYFDAASLIRNIADLFGPLTEQKNIDFSIDVPDTVLIQCDKDKFEKIIFNLLSNAFKHTAAGESIRCEVGVNEADRTLLVSVSNSGFQGEGVDLSFLFEQFYTLQQNENVRESSGIGLALTKQLAELLGGTIAVSTKEAWIRFNLILPLQTDAEYGSTAPVATLSDRPSYLVSSIAGSLEVIKDSVSENNDLALMENLEVPGKKSILVVEDDPGIRLLLKETLQEQYVVYEAENGHHAIALLKKIIPNLILSDVLMGEMDGLTLCSKIKNNVETCHIPFLILSARGSAEQKLEGFEAGADGYLTKPYSTQELLKKIKSLIDYQENVQQFLNKDGYTQPLSHNGLKSEDFSFLSQIAQIISDHLADAGLDAVMLENTMSMSRMSLYRKLKALTNMTPAELIKHYRLKHAATLLLTTQLTVSEVYYQTGFNNQSYFFREFKRVYHVSPKEFRELASI